VSAQGWSELLADVCRLIVRLIGTRARDYFGRAWSGSAYSGVPLLIKRMLQRLERVGIVVDDLAAATAFFVELGVELQGEGPVEGDWVDRIVGLEGVRVGAAMMKTRTATDGSSW
jgi:hypothetical protein